MGLDFTALIPGAIATVKIAGGAWILSILLGFFFTNVRETNIKPLIRATNFFTTLVRAIPELVMLYLVYFGITYFGVKMGSLTAAIVALGIAESAFTAEYFRAALQTVEPSQRKAAESLGLNRRQILLKIVVPQAFPFAVPPIINSFIGLVKTATLASAVGAVELLYAGQDMMNRTGQVVPVAIALVVIYIVATLPLTTLVSKLEVRVRERSARA